MQINIDKIKFGLIHDRSHSRTHLIDSNTHNQSKERFNNFGRRGSTFKNGEKENTRPQLLNSHDSLVQGFLAEKSSKQSIESLKKSISKLKGEQITISKESLLGLIDRMASSRSQTDDTIAFKKSISVFEKKPQLTLSYLEDMKNAGLRNLVNEKFDDVLGSSEKGTSKGRPDKVSEAIQKLFQKEMLFEQCLNLLTEDEVDINQLLFCAFERIQSENYCPPTGQSVLLDGYFEFADQLQMPTTHWLRNKSTAKEFRLNIDDIREEECLR